MHLEQLHTIPFPLESMDMTIFNLTSSILLLLISLPPFFSDSTFVECSSLQQETSTRENPYSPKASLIRYWNAHISNGIPKPSFLLSKASPLTALHSSHLVNLAARNDRKDLSSNYASFCNLANLFCLLPDPSAQTFPKGEKGTGRSGEGLNFANYNMQFSAYEVNKNNTGSSFSNYSDETNFGVAVFKDYSKEGGGGTVTFANYSNGAKFAQYSNASGQPPPEPQSLRKDPRSLVEAGKFFRESQLREGNVMPMPDIRDKMPKRSFLPRSIVSRLPFSSSRINELKKIFNAADNSSMEWVILNALTVCEKIPSPGETKKCVGSIEDMIDFATSVLGHNVVVRTTENVNGASKNVMIGSLKAINGGKVTKAVSCHQSLYPYLLYYCHSVPKVKVYEADILDVNSKQKINHGVAICHLDTSTWSPLHAAFLALGYGPGKIEACHWIFENDMTWNWAG